VHMPEHRMPERVVTDSKVSNFMCK
jgi:hypothetical protein